MENGFKGNCTPKEIYELKDLNLTQKILLSMVLNLCIKTGECTASNGYFAELLNIKKMVVSRNLSVLYTKKYILYTEKYIPLYQKVYRVILPGIGGIYSKVEGVYTEKDRGYILKSITYNKEDNKEDIKEDNKDKKPGEQKSSPVHKLIKADFLKYYSWAKKTEYYFEAKDGAAIKGLILKIRFKLKELNIEETDQNIQASFQEFLKGVWNSKEQWIKDKFTLTILNSQFNEQYSKIRSGQANSMEQALADHFANNRE